MKKAVKTKKTKVIKAKNSLSVQLLTEEIPNILEMLRGNIKVETERPSKDEWRQRFQRVSEAAKYLQKELTDWKGFYPMLLTSPATLPYEHEFHEFLAFLITRCNEKMNGFPKAQGGRKPVSAIDKTPDAKTLCALAVILIWKRRYKSFPGVHNSGAHNACNDLWLAAAGTKRGGWGSTLEGWRTYITAAKKLQNSWQAKALLRDAKQSL